MVRPAGGGRLRVAGVGVVGSPVRVGGPGSQAAARPGAQRRQVRQLPRRPRAARRVLRWGHGDQLVSIDTYVRGVVAGEMPSSWDYDALRAQAVTARTYALATRKTGDVFDLFPDTRSQVYLGVTGETARTNRAVADSSNEVVTYNGEIATTFFFSTSGGKTENVELSFLGAEPQPWLKSVSDPYDNISPKHRWRVALLQRPDGRPARRAGRLPPGRGAAPRPVAADRAGAGGGQPRLAAPHRREHPRAPRPVRLVGVIHEGLDLPGARERAAAARGPVGLPLDRRRVRSRAALGAVGGGAARGGAGGAAWAPFEVSRRGRYSSTVAAAGLYRVRSGSLVGPVVRVR